MTKHSIAIAPALLALACALVLAACGKSEEGHAGEAEAHEATASSSAGLPSGDLEAGKKLASTKNAETGQACVDCHGADGNKPIDPTYPKLGGQYASYLEHALQAYRKGDRENALMAGQAKTLTDQQIADLGAYFSAAPSELRDLHGSHD
ncbi:cytochrome c [Lysobacter sp. CFH 32150]|uniref:c-type cytochrome n=1 Tax=Lysobacter sp. CFH 32150 TaxID=2927128 RepID=UPI001FA782BD|nr:cytochrome c [Lysobacter sp. CFH 32150]MCI4566445.1 cytochrome c [Lysobacter sp. CFH 32150]